MAIQVNGTQVIGNSRELTNIASVDATTAAAINAAGVGEAPFNPTTVSGTSPSLNVGSNNYFQQGALTGNTTVSFASVPTTANWRYSFQQAVIADEWNLAKAVLGGTRYNTNSDGIGSARQGVYITPTGHKLFLGGYNSNTVNEYDLGTPFDAESMKFVRTKSVAGTGTIMSVTFKPDGTEMYLCGYGPNHWAQWTLSTAWNISTATLTRTASSSSPQEPTGLTFKPDGTKAYEVAWSGADVREYSLSTAWNISSKSNSATVNFGYQSNALRGVTFSDDGRHVYVCGNSKLDQYYLSTAWNISTRSNIRYKNITGSVQDVFIKGDGGRLWACFDSSSTPVGQLDVGDVAILTVPSSVVGKADVGKPFQRVTYEFTTLNGGTNVNLINSTS